MICSKCGFVNPGEFQFCGNCGQRTGELRKDAARFSGGERKYVTILFSDLSGYTALTEKLDPEEVKAIMDEVFDRIRRVLSQYDGFIERFIGDAVMAIFGIPKAHEDDAVRAIHAARAIHRQIDGLSSRFIEKVGMPLSMHSGINTGLVVTGDFDAERGANGLTGFAVNLASRLEDLSRAGEILVGYKTYLQANRYFEFFEMEPVRVKGKSEPVPVYRVVSPKKRPVTTHRLSGIRADLIGRKSEMAELREAVANLKNGKGRIISVCGDAGAGKSRLMEELKATVDLGKVQWLEGHAYAYAQNMPYFLLVDLLNEIFQIDEDDSPAEIREKLQSEIEALLGATNGAVPYVGGLYSLRYPEVEDVSPEFWKSRLQSSILEIFAALARRAPTVFFFEDVHWADPSSVELLRRACLEIKSAILIYACRPPLDICAENQLSKLGDAYHEIALRGLSVLETNEMLESLLNDKNIPPDLVAFVRNKAEGNPFYLEELVNSLIDSDILVRDIGTWKISKPLSELTISPSINGLISYRLDRLEGRTKRILQEASVIGRTFLYDVLQEVTEHDGSIAKELKFLEQLNIIRTLMLGPDLQYIFKHSLTQEVVYNSLLKKEREDIHERIAQVMEDVFSERLPEFYEILAFHYSRSRSVVKAAEYLTKAGEKSLARYSVEEANGYLKNAFDLLTHKRNRTRSEDIALVDVLNNWGYVFYYLGEVNAFLDLLDSQEELAESIRDDARYGMFNAWCGISHFLGGRPREAYDHLHKALILSQTNHSDKVEGYACTWLTWACTELGLYKDAEEYGKRAQRIAVSLSSDPYLYFKSLGGLSFLRVLCKGELQEGHEAARLLLRYGEENANSRSIVLGHWVKSMSYLFDHELGLSHKEALLATGSAKDPVYLFFGNLMRGWSNLLSGELEEAEDALQSIVDYGERTGTEEYSVIAYIFLGAAIAGRGRMGKGMRMLDRANHSILKYGRKTLQPFYEYTMGMLYSQIAIGPRPKFAVLTKNIGFLFKNVPFAAKRAEKHYMKAIEIARQLEANCILGLSCFDLSLLYKSRKQDLPAREFMREAASIFEKGGYKNMLKEAREVLDGLG